MQGKLLEAIMQEKFNGALIIMPGLAFVATYVCMALSSSKNEQIVTIETVQGWFSSEVVKVTFLGLFLASIAYAVVFTFKTIGCFEVLAIINFFVRKTVKELFRVGEKITA